MIYYDSHVHTSFSTDSNEPMESMVLQAINKNLRGIVFTDHMDYNFPQKYDWNTPADTAPFTFDTASYFDCINMLRQNYEKKISIFTGVEIGLKEDALEQNRLLSNNLSLDYVIGSIHLIDNIDPYYDEYWEMYEEKKGLLKYFETTYENITHLNEVQIDTLGHLDYIARYSPSGNKVYNYKLFSDIIDEILRTIISHNICLEVNTSGYEKGGNMPNPNLDILKRYFDLGGECITFGSDAHNTERIAKHFNDAESLVRQAGFKHYITFSKRKPVFHQF